MNQGFTWGLVLGRREGLETREALRTGLVCSALGTSPAAIVVTQRVAARRAEQLAPPPPKPDWEQIKSRLCAELAAATAIEEAPSQVLESAIVALGCNEGTPTGGVGSPGSEEDTETLNRGRRTRRS